MTSLPAYVPAAIAAEMRRAVDTLAALGLPADRIETHLAEFAALVDAPRAYSVMVKGTPEEIAPLLVPLVKAGFGWNVVLLASKCALVVQFHACTHTVGVPFGGKLRFGVDCAGFWGADPMYTGSVVGL